MALAQLLNRLDDTADPVQQHLWLIDLVQWIRGDASSVSDIASRLDFFLGQLENQPDLMQRLQRWWRQLATGLDGATLLSNYDMASSNAFMSELVQRLHRICLPSSPDTNDASELFALVFNHPSDTKWIGALPASTLQRLSHVLTAPANSNDLYTQRRLTLWQETLLDAITFCTSQIRAAGFSPDLRLRMSDQARASNPFFSLASDCDALRLAWLDNESQPERLELAVQQLRKQLDACRLAAASIYSHLDAYGISTNLVFRLRQLRERILRVRALLDCLLNDSDHAHTARLVAHLSNVTQQQKSIGALISSNTSLLAAKIAERSSETGEHYITRNRAEYRNMLRYAAGGGALTSVTTALKFAVMAFGFSAFWGGFWVGLMYAASFVAIQMLHLTLATKQPAMTAPAMAAKLKDQHAGSDTQAFVNEVTHLVRSQVAAVVGNVALVFPVTIVLSVAIFALTGQHIISKVQAAYVLHTLHLLGPTLLYAAFTGVLLFASSIVAGWVENWFVLHRLDSALRYNPKVTSLLGVARAKRWALFARNNISGLSANISLGLMLGMVPPILSFIGPTIDVRHVTLSAGQLGAAVASMGTDIFLLPAFWWAACSIPFIALCNVGVSFYLAFRVALQAHNVSVIDRTRISRAIFARFKQSPGSFFWPAKEPSTGNQHG